ncbi:hypothetical protein B0H11DRAFT_1642487, partial [Mycena galericulata]
FRRVCNVPGRDWPDPELVRTNEITYERYPTPFFEAKVTDARNQALFLEVAQQAMQELKVSSSLTKGDIGLTRIFVGQKLLAQGPQAPSDRTRPDVGSRSLRWNSAKESSEVSRNNGSRGRCRSSGTRRCESHYGSSEKAANQIKFGKVLAAYAAQHGIDLDFLKVLVDEQFLSDEVSGPEDDSGESKDAWKVRLAAKAQMPLWPDALKRVNFHEILDPAWRSRSGALVHDIQDFRVSGTTPADELNVKYDRVALGRPSHRIPTYAPFNFGYSVEWPQQKPQES